jgi:hypothetical protein
MHEMAEWSQIGELVPVISSLDCLPQEGKAGSVVMCVRETNDEC